MIVVLEGLTAAAPGLATGASDTVVDLSGVVAVCALGIGGKLGVDLPVDRRVHVAYYSGSIHLISPLNGKGILRLDIT